MGSELGDFKRARKGSGPRLYPFRELRGCSQKNRKAGGPAFLVLRGPWAGVVL